MGPPYVRQTHMAIWVHLMILLRQPQMKGHPLAPPMYIKRTHIYRMITSKGILLTSTTDAGASSSPAHVHVTSTHCYGSLYIQLLLTKI